MTIRPRDQAMLPAAAQAQPPGSAEAFDALDPIEPLADSVLGSDARAIARDMIWLSARARLLLRAGLAIHAFVIDALTHTYHTITLGTRTITLEFGLYR
jgi:hypothetical protein